MATEAFESWAPKEIRRLRQEADVMQLALDRYQAAQGRKPKSTPNGSVSTNDSQGRRSKYGALFTKWVDASQNGPIGYATMEQIARDAGFDSMNKNLLRSTVHAAKQAGRVLPVGDGYVWQESSLETASPVQEDTVS